MDNPAHAERLLSGRPGWDTAGIKARLGLQRFGFRKEDDMRNTNRLRKPNMLVLAVCLILSLIAIMIIADNARQNYEARDRKSVV